MSETQALLHAAQYAEKNGGATLDADFNVVSHSTGYYVSVAGHEVTVKHCDGAALHLYREQHYKPGHYIGVWLDPDTDLWCLDLTLHVTDYDEAMRFAQQNEQRAIFDCAAQDCIEVQKVAV